MESLDDTRISVKWQAILLGLILASCFAVRLWTIGAPAVDRTAWKEIDYIYISQNYWKHGFQFLYPEIGWPAEPPRYTAMELPLAPYLAACLYAVRGFDAFSVRFVPLVAYLITTFYVFLLARREVGAPVGLLAALVAAVLPLHHYFGRFLQSEPLVLATSVMCLYHFVRWHDTGGRRHWLTAWAGFSLAISLKLTPLYLVLPLAHAAVRHDGRSAKAACSVAIFVGASLLLPLAWYGWAHHLAHAYLDIFGIFGGKAGGHDKFQTFTMLSSLDWHYTIAARVYRLLGGTAGVALALIGMITAARARIGGLFWSYLAAIVLYTIIVAEGHLDAPYRQLTLVPPTSVFLAIGAVRIASWLAAMVRGLWPHTHPNSVWPGSLFLPAACLILIIPVVHYPRIFRAPQKPCHRGEWQFAQTIRRQCNPGSKLITVGEYTIHKGGNDLSPVLYYYAGLPGWTLQRGQWDTGLVEELIRRGATHLAATHLGREPEALPFIEEMGSTYRVLYERKGRLLIQLPPTVTPRCATRVVPAEES